jgi:serine/threonine protein kinase
VDFGISKFYKNNQGVHIEFSDDKPFIGTTRYASIAAHKKYEMSRRDDLESLGYMLVYLLKGSFIILYLKR